MYGGFLNSLLSSETPVLQIPGILWKLLHKSSLLDNVYNWLITRSEVDWWYDAFLLSVAIFIYAFGYAYTRYSEHVNGGYPNTMMPLYVADKGISWVALWTLVVCPFWGGEISPWVLQLRRIGQQLPFWRSSLLPCWMWSLSIAV